MKKELTRRSVHPKEEGRLLIRQARERLGLRFRDVEEASTIISQRYGNDEFTVHISRLSAIENEGAVPNIYKMYSLCAIYRLDMGEALSWYGVDLGQVGTDSLAAPGTHTHLLGYDVPVGSDAMLPISLDPSFDSRKSSFLSRVVQKWGTMPLMLLQRFDTRNYRYGFVGEEDHWMFPLLQPGALLLIDEAKTRIERGPFLSEMERPLYFVQTRDGEHCTWLADDVDMLSLVPHSLSGYAPKWYPREQVEIIGQIVGMATRLDSARRRRG